MLVLVCYGLRRGREPAVPGRPLRPAERLGMGFDLWRGCRGLERRLVLWARWEPPGHSVKALATGIAVAGLRGLAAALLCTSLGFDWRLRALALARARSPS